MVAYSRQRSRKRFGISKLIVVGAVSAVALLAFAGMMALLLSSKPVDYDGQLNSGLRKLKKEQTQEALQEALSIDIQKLKTPSEKSKLHLILGAGYLDEAEKAGLRQRAISRAVEAHKELEASKSIGSPEGTKGLETICLAKFSIACLNGLKPLNLLKQRSNNGQWKKRSH